MQSIAKRSTGKFSEGRSATTVHHLHAVLHVALEGTVRPGLVYRTPVNIVDPPRVPHYEMTTLAEVQAKRLLAAAAGDRLYALYAKPWYRDVPG